MFRLSDPKGFDELMCSPHFLTVKVQLVTLTGSYKADYTDRFMDGVVSVDADAAVTRALDLTLFDPFRQVALDPTTPSKTGIFIADMLKVWYVIESPDRMQKYTVPVFTGPIDDVERDEVFIKIKALGKESLGLNNSWAARTYKKGQRKTDVIKRILRDEIGETSVYIPSSTQKLTSDTKLNREKSPWVVAKALVKTMGKRLVYDADGTAVAKKLGRTSTYKFTERNLTAHPKISYDLSVVTNVVLVVGKKPKKGKKKVQYTAVAPKSHPLSPTNLGRPGAGRYLWTIVEDQNLTSVAACKALAKKLLAQGLLAGVDVQFSGIPNPRLHELDIVSIDVNGVKAQFPLRKFTIPLRAGADASYGYLSRSKPRANPGRGGVRSRVTTGKR